MSLLDDVSIVVTPNGYKAGELYAVVPVPTEGAEEVVNGDFATDSDWTKETGWTISGGTANYSGGTSNRNIRQAIGITNGKTYKIQYQVTAITSGEVACRFGGMSGVDEITATTTGTYVGYISANSSVNGELLFEDNDNNFVGSIDNVSVKEYTSADMDVTRATAATRVDENGLVNYAEVIGGEEVPSIIGILNAGGGTITQISGNSYSSTSDGTSGSGIRPKFDFNTTAGKRYKLTITPTGTISGTINFDFYDGSSYLFQNYDFTTTKEIYFIDNGSVFGAFDGAKTYDVSSFTVSVKEVTRDNVPRIDYTGGGCPHILAEPMRTNLFPYSEDFSNTAWSKFRSSLTINQTTSPDGTINAYLIEQDYPNTSVHGGLADSITMTSGVEYTYSFFVKKKEYSWIELAEAATSAANTSTWFDIENGVVGIVGAGSTAQIKDFGNGWYRCSISFTSLNTSSRNLTLYLARGDGSTTADFEGGVYIWGAQLEAGSYATSYIPTSGITVTRNQDIFTRDGIGSLIGSEGVLFVEMAALSNDGTNRGISLNDGTSSNRLLLYFSAASNQIAVISTGFAGSIIYTLPDETSFNKIAVRYKANDITLWVDGESRGTPITSATIPTFTALKFDSGSLSSPFFGKVKQLQVYDTSLSDEQLLQLTGESGTDFYESYAEMASALTYTIQ